MTISKETSSRSGPSGRKRVLDAVASTETSMTPDLLRLVSVLREQMHATLSRSDALKPLAWLIVIIMTTAVASQLLIGAGRFLPAWPCPPMPLPSVVDFAAQAARSRASIENEGIVREMLRGQLL